MTLQLTKVLINGDFLDIIYPDSKNISTKLSLIKGIKYDAVDDCIVIIKYNKTIISLNYLEVEDPLNLGHSFFSSYALWVYLMNIMGASIPVPVPPVVFTPIKYGYLYNRMATNDLLFCPSGWHIPTEEEFNTLLSNTGGTLVSGGKLKETGFVYWDSPNTDATNEFGFNFRGTGRRSSGGPFSVLNQSGYLRGSGDITLFSTEYNDPNAWFPAGSIWTIATAVRLLKDNSTNPLSLTDLDGNVYPTVKIGPQVWTAQNWKCTKLNNGTPIPKVTDNTAWAALATGAYCAYNNDENNV